MSAQADLVMQRRLEVSRAEVWRAWTDCDRMKQWWGPSGYTVTYCSIDLRPGERFLTCMRSPDGKDIWSTGTYLEVVPNERIVVTDSFADEQGNVVSPTHYGFAPDFPRELRLIVTLEDRDGATELTVRHHGIPLGEDYGSTRIGWSQSLRKLARLLEPAVAGLRH